MAITEPASTNSVIIHNETSNTVTRAKDGTDSITIDGKIADYQWGPTEDGSGTIVWTTRNAGNNILFDIENIVFSDGTVNLKARPTSQTVSTQITGETSTDAQTVTQDTIQEIIIADEAGVSQYVNAGTGNNDVFKLNGAAKDFGWSPVKGGTGFVIWARDGSTADFVNDVETLRFSDGDIALSKFPNSDMTTTEPSLPAPVENTANPVQQTPPIEVAETETTIEAVTEDNAEIEAGPGTQSTTETPADQTLPQSIADIVANMTKPTETTPPQTATTTTSTSQTLPPSIADMIANATKPAATAPAETANVTAEPTTTTPVEAVASATTAPAAMTSTTEAPVTTAPAASAATPIITTDTEGKDSAHTDVATSHQLIDGGDGQDKFIINGNAADYSWRPTRDDSGAFVIWSNQGEIADKLVNIETIQFNDRTISLSEDPVQLHVKYAAANPQYFSGNTATDSAAENNTTIDNTTTEQTGTDTAASTSLAGTDAPADTSLGTDQSTPPMLTPQSQAAENDGAGQTDGVGPITTPPATNSDTIQDGTSNADTTPPNTTDGTVMTRYDNDPQSGQVLKGDNEKDVFVVDGNSADYTWLKTVDGSFMVYNKDDNSSVDILNEFEYIEFNDTTIELA